MTRLAIYGAGAFGTALAVTYARAGHDVTLWTRERAPEIATSREAPRLPGVTLPEAVAVTDDPGIAADIALLAVPTQSLGDLLDRLRPDAPRLVSCAKGIDMGSGLGPATLVSRACPDATVAQLTGPSFAVDIAAGLPTALTLACADDAEGEALQSALSTPFLRLYRTTDVIGAELGGALKNVIAIAAGAVIGAGLGDSARAALIARGFAEMRRVARAAGAREETLTGLSGLGDLVLTCGSEKSRNFRYGAALATGAAIDPEMTVEGLHTARGIAADATLDTPIADAVAALADGRLDFAAVLDTLLARPLKAE
ncbi:NAD(P)H-dependent glycerol-3-phosphate dehydrogenase [Roseibacterium sp. SDUM158016]|jgi:glycerol-3-phosphate dehydrogenase (NAD(P)+)|uniref:NAD(P)H-dependent glycerol-3-phosphate dehydrogenase n=1 Tax=Roseicyclus sediminis TaxID=2980997 RepID=UPI0021CEF7B6|nr:NAD(P)H-dependent glycerol-3-phosphate dehydrogenase [Roseibacterium sp. SDUM158016]MCU4651554.1 NAD(P)H-dependent glycerol-3-phosphate dehydrogenase [Roseibacterium sp. SDUM158016]